MIAIDAHHHLSAAVHNAARPARTPALVLSTPEVTFP